MVGLPLECGLCGWSSEEGSGKVTAKCQQTPGAAGNACGGANDAPCRAGFFCQLAHDGTSGRCAPALAVGAACMPPQGDPSERRCTAGATCVDGHCRGKGALGESCSGYGIGDVLADSCADELACSKDSRACSAVTLGKPSDACDSQALRCDHGFCDVTTSTCIALKAVGAACDARDVRDRCEGLARCRMGQCRLDDPGACN